MQPCQWVQALQHLPTIYRPTAPHARDLMGLSSLVTDVSSPLIQAGLWHLAHDLPFQCSNHPNSSFLHKKGLMSMPRGEGEGG